MVWKGRLFANLDSREQIAQTLSDFLNPDRLLLEGSHSSSGLLLNTMITATLKHFR